MNRVMKKEKQFHATLLKNGTYMCKVQVNKKRVPFYGKTEEIAIKKASEWYHAQIENKEKEIVIEKIEEPSQNELCLYEYLKSISENLTKLCKGNIISEDKYLTVKDMADYLKISESQAYNIIHRPDFPRQKIGRDYRISFLELKDYLKSHRFNQIEV